MKELDDSELLQELLERVIEIAQIAGAAILEVYETSDAEVSIKDDNSPLTKADKTAHSIIERKLQAISDFPVISEEGRHDAREAAVFWLIDPLDGTKEFLKRNGEFTVNIALIKDEVPVLGVVYAPAKELLYAGIVSRGAYKIVAGKRQEITSVFTGATPKILVSRSHRDALTETLLQKIGEYEEASSGSSLKLCLVAEGRAALYPRLAPTYEWDTAAGDCVVRAAGGKVQDLYGQPLRYHPHAQKNPFFVVSTGNDEWFQVFRNELKDFAS